MSISPEKLFPYIVPSGYLQHMPNLALRVAQPIGHSLFRTLVLDFDGLVQSVDAATLESMKLTQEAASVKSIDNLIDMAGSGAVRQQIYPNGPSGKPFVVFSDHWTSAACILL